MATPPPPPPPPGGGAAPGSGGIPTRTFGEIFSAAFELYKENFTKLIGLVAIVVIPLTLLQYFLTNEVLVKDAVLDLESGTITTTGWGEWWAVLGVSVLIGVIVQSILNGAIARAAAGTAIGESISTEAVYKFGLARLGPIIWISILVGLATLGGFILLIIPGIYIWVKLSVTVQALVVENKRGTEAMSRSWNLTKGYGWQVFGILIVTYILAGIVTGIITAIFGDNWFLAGLGASVAQIIVLPFTALVLIVMYLDLRVRKENLDVATLQNDMRSSAV
ncbi:MAG: hypothetical protein WD206_05145 [Actinomycetota bacterium]